MHPALRDGEIVTLRPALAYRPGDIVGVARADGTLTLHRLLGYRPSRRGLAVWTQADRADAPDPAALLARVKRLLRTRTYPAPQPQRRNYPWPPV